MRDVSAVRPYCETLLHTPLQMIWIIYSLQGEHAVRLIVVFCVAVVGASQVGAQPCFGWLEDFFWMTATPDEVKGCLTDSFTAARTEEGMTPLHFASGFSDSPEIIATIVSAGANVNTRTENGDTPLHIAARHNANVAIITALYEAGANVNARKKSSWTPLHVAAAFNKTPEVTSTFIHNSADVNVRNSAGHTPLHLAAGFCQPAAVVKALLVGGADVNSRDEDGWMPLHAAALSGYPEIIDALLDAGADVNAHNSIRFFPEKFQNCGGGLVRIPPDAFRQEQIFVPLVGPKQVDHGETPLHIAAGFNKDVAATITLLNAGADVNALNRKGQTPLHVAAQYTFAPQVIEVLLGAAAVGSLLDKSGKKPVDYAKSNSSLFDTEVYWLLNDAAYGG